MVAVVCAALSACGATEPKGPAAITANPSPSISGRAGEVAYVVVSVTDAAGAPMPAQRVSFNVASGGGAVTPSVAASGPNGEATAVWTLGPTMGMQTLAVSADGVPPITFIATVSSAITGAWGGSVGSQSLNLSLIESFGTVVGTGTITNSQSQSGVIALSANGTYSPASGISLTASSGTITPFTLKGPLVDRKILGVLNGSGFSNNAITLVRR